MIAALATDPDVMTRSGGTFITAELARDYGITDIDGKVIPSLRATARRADLVAGMTAHRTMIT